MPTKSQNSASASEPGSNSGQPKPKLILPLGRGHNGKSFWTRWMIDRAQTQGRNIVVADADRTNPALAAYFDGVLTPPSADAEDVEEWFLALIDQQYEQRFNIVIDLGGGDQLLKSLARRLDLKQFSERFGVEPVAVHLLTPDLDDLAYLRDLEADALFAPEATILVLNEGRVEGRKPFESAFKPVLEHRIFTAAMKRGAKPIAMPRLAGASEITVQRLTMSAAEAGHFKNGLPPLGPTKRQFIAKWFRDMEQNFAPVAAWLA